MNESEETAPQEESLDLPRVFKRESLAPTFSNATDYETATELDNIEVASSASDIGSAIFDHDYISTHDFQENIQLAMRRSDSSDDQAIRQLMYDEDGIKFNVQDIEGRFKLLINISSSILNSRSAELADHASVTNFLSKLCEQTECLKEKFSQADGQIPDTDSGRASKTPPSMEEEEPLVEDPVAPVDSAKEIPTEQAVDEPMEVEGDSKEPETSAELPTEASGETQIEATKQLDEVIADPSMEIQPISPESEPQLEIKQENPATCLDEESMANYTEILDKVDSLSKVGTDVVTSMDELRKNLPLSVSPEVLAESRGVLTKKVIELQRLLKTFLIDDNSSAEIGIQTEKKCHEISEIGVQTCEELPTETPSTDTAAEIETPRIDEAPPTDAESLPVAEEEPSIEKRLKIEEPELSLEGVLPGDESDYGTPEGEMPEAPDADGETPQANVSDELGEANLSADLPETEDPNDISLDNEVEKPDAETSDVPEADKGEENSVAEVDAPKTSEEKEDDSPPIETVDESVDPANLLVVAKVESTEIQNERMKRKLLDMLDSSSDEAFSEDDTDDDPTFSIRMLKRRRRQRKQLVEDSDEEQEQSEKATEQEPDKAVPATNDGISLEDSEAIEDALAQDSDAEFDLLQYTTSDVPEDESFTEMSEATEETEKVSEPIEQSEKISEEPESISESTEVEKITDSAEITENIPLNNISTEQIAEEALDIVKEEMPEKIYDDIDLANAVPEDFLNDVDLLDKLPDDAEMLGINDAELGESQMEDNTELTSIVEETKNVILLNNEEISSQNLGGKPKENGHEEDQEDQMEEGDESSRGTSNHAFDLDGSMSGDSGDSDSSKGVPAASLEPVVSVETVETMDKKSLEDLCDDINDKEIDKLLDFTSLERRRYETSRVTESKESDKPRKTEKKKDKLLDIIEEVKVGEVSESSSESEEDDLTEEQFLQQCNMNMKHRLLNFSSEESGEESNDISLNKLYKKKSGDEDDDVDSINSDASAIVDDFLMNIVQKKIAEDVGEEKESEDEVKDAPKENNLPQEDFDGIEGEADEVPVVQPEPSTSVVKEVVSSVEDSPSDVQIVEDTPEEEVSARDNRDEAETDKDEASTSKPKAPKVSSVEKIIMSDKIFEGIDVRKDLMKDKIHRQLRIISSDEESEKESKDDGCLDTSMFHKKVTAKSSEEINRILAKYDINKGNSSHAKDTRPPSETISLSSESDVDEVVEEEVEKEAAPRRNIRAMLSEDQLEVETKRAQREERDRIARLEKKTDTLTQRLTQSQSEDLTQDESEVVLDYHTKKKKFISVHPAIVQQLKPHQIDGVRFMYDNVYGGVDYVDKHAGSGCILAHCMGLGKTLQLIALLHTVIRYPELKTNRILVICPKTTIMNWFEEIRKWLKPVRGDVSMKVFYFPDNSDVYAKLKILKEWHKSGEKGYRNAGCLLIGYEAFRVLVLKQSKKQSLYTQQETALIKKQVSETLLDPGADLVICDEGHMIKNKKSAINQAVTKIRTKRRIILTGTPIQNNLKEYYCMVNFIKPNFLGTEKEFANLYTNPIKSGQHKDSTKVEIKCMKQRSYVLHKKLSRFVQRREAAVLKQFLPEKFEYVLFIPMTEVQERLYEFFLVHNPNKEISGKSLIPDYTALRKIWTHPKVLENAWENARVAKEKKERARARLHADSEDEAPDDVLDKQVGVMSVMNDWWRPHLTRDDLESILPSNKLRLIFEILKLCQQNGEKCLIFSAFVAVLNVVENFMRKISNKTPESAERYGLTDYEGPWEHGKDFYRLDGKTPKTLRHSMVQSFNDPLNTRMRVFLISAKAGGQGINLTGANRVIILDTSWNPSNDQQNIFRIYRLGQESKCYVYRLLAVGTMEEKVYSRSVTKQAMSYRVVDEQQIDRHYSMAELAELYTLTKTDMSQRPVPNLPIDFLLRSLLHNHYNLIYKYHEHDSLLENKPEQDLSEADKKEAWDAYENDLKTQRLVLGGNDAGAFDQSSLGTGLLGLNNYFNASNSNIPGAISYGNQVGRPYGSSNYNSGLSQSALFNQLSSFQPGMGMNQELMLMNQLYQNYPMGMGSSGMQSPYMGYMNQNSYYGGGLYPTSSNSSIASSASLGSPYKSLQNLADIAMLPDANLIPTTSGSPSGSHQHMPVASSPGLGAALATSPSSMTHMQRSTPSRSMWNLMSAPNFYSPGATTAGGQQQQSGAKTTQANSTVISSSVSSTQGASPRQFPHTSAALGQKSPHTSIPTSVITSIPSTSAGHMQLPTYSRAENTVERPTSSSSPQPHVILKATNSPAIHHKEKEHTSAKVTNMGIVYPTVESRDGGVPSLASLSPATITKISTTTAQKTAALPNAINTKLTSLLGLHNVTVTPSAKVTKPPSTTLTPIVTTTVKQGAKGIVPVASSLKTAPQQAREMPQSTHSMTVKPTTVAATNQLPKRQAYVYTAKGKKPVQVNQRVLVGNQTSITPVKAVPATKATTLTPVTYVRTAVTQGGTPTKTQGAHLTRVSRLVPSTITSPQIAVQQVQKQPVQLQKVQQPIVLQKAPPQFQKVQQQQPMQIQKVQHPTPLQKVQQQIVQRVQQPVQVQKVLQQPVQLQKVQQPLQKIQQSPQKVQQPIQLQRIQQPLQVQKLQQPPQLIKVQQTPGKPGTRTVTIRKPPVQLATNQPGTPKLLHLPQKRPSTTSIAELIGNSSSVSITQVKRPNLATTSKPIPAPQSTATLQKITVPVRRTVNKVPPTVVSKDPEIVELD